jgi:periplasmic protein TonB
MVHHPRKSAKAQPLISEPSPAVIAAVRIEPMPTPARAPLPQPRQRLLPVVAILTALLFFVACLAAYLAGRAGILTIPPALASKLPVRFTQASTQPEPVAAVPIPESSANRAITTSPTPAKPQPGTPLAGSTIATSAVPVAAATRPEPAVDKGLNTQAVIHKDSSSSNAGAPPQLATNLSGMTLVPASGIVPVPPASPVVKAAPAIKPPTAPLQVSSGVMQGSKFAGPNPEYPAWARTAHVFGDVVLQATITKNGDVANLSVISGPVGLRDSAVSAVSKWKYHPYRLNGDPVEVQTRITVKFSLNPNGL